MIIYGTRTKLLAQELLPGPCPHCSTQNSVDIFVIQKYAHVFWIPFFPLSKTGLSQCSHCKQVLKLKEMPDSMRSVYERIRPQTKTPAWTFSGLALLALLITVLIINGRQRDARNAKLILSPESGDIFEIRLSSNEYTLYKVYDVRGDSVIVRMHEYQVNKASGLSQLKNKGEAGYPDEASFFLKSELKEMLDRGTIMDIDRK